MVKGHLNKIFLAASIPTFDRKPKYYDTADIVAIRDAVRALAAVVIPKAHLVWGGHPSITPLIKYVLEKLGHKSADHVTLYQSRFFERKYPVENADFKKVIITASGINRSQSLQIMRKQMFRDNDFKVAVFIGGMEGIQSEYSLFRIIRPNALVLPVASTGGATKMIYDRNPENFNTRLADDYAFMALFRDLLADFIQ